MPKNTLTRISKFINWFKKEHSTSNTTSTDDIKSAYNQLAASGDYDFVVEYERRSNELQQVLNGLVNENAKVLDLACGTGAYIQAAINLGAKDVVGVDLTPGMLDVARKRFAGTTAADNIDIDLINASFLDIDFSENQFDLITMANAARYITPGREIEFFEKVKKWLKPDGFFVINSDSVTSNFVIERIGALLIKLATNPQKLNPKTGFDHTLRSELEKYFEIKDVRQVGNDLVIKHWAYICAK